MADSKVSALTADASPTTDDLIYTVNDPGGTPQSRRVTLSAALSAGVGSVVQGYDATLAALASYNTNGLIAQTASDTFAGRTITGTSNQISVSNGDGVSGNPTLSTPQNIHTAATPQFAGIGIGVAAGASGIKLSGGSAIYPSADSTTALNVTKADGSTAVLTVDTTNGYLGINCTPTQPLEIVRSDSLNAVFKAQVFISTNAGPGMSVRKARNTSADPRRAQSNDALFGFNAGGYYAADDVSAATEGGNSVQFRGMSSEAFTSTAQGARLEFRTTPLGSTTLQTRCVFSAAGNVIIGTATEAGTSAAATLMVENGTAPASSPTNAVQVYSEDVSSSAVLKVRTEAGDIIKLYKTGTYTPSNVSTDRSYDANATTVDELADVLGTLIADLQLTGLIG